MAMAQTLVRSVVIEIQKDYGNGKVRIGSIALMSRVVKLQHWQLLKEGTIIRREAGDPK